MASTRTELLAFFDHYDRILAMLPEGDATLTAKAAEWLIHNMSWQLGRLHPAAFYGYLDRACARLSAIEEALWSESVFPVFAARSFAPLLQHLRRGDPLPAIDHLTTSRLWSDVSEVKDDVAALTRDMAQVRRDLAQVRHDVQALAAISEHAVIRRSLDRREREELVPGRPTPS